jgi:hypothetical protein
MPVKRVQIDEQTKQTRRKAAEVLGARETIHRERTCDWMGEPPRASEGVSPAALDGTPGGVRHLRVSYAAMVNGGLRNGVTPQAQASPRAGSVMVVLAAA